MAEDKPQRTVVVDMGSNSFRLVTYDYVPDRWWRRSDEIYDGVRIGAGLARSGSLAPERIERALAVLEVYAHFCGASGIPLSRVTPVATSAIRDATNGAEFVARAHALTGLPIRILKAEEEAYYSYLAAVNSTTISDGAVLDLGGGSLQLVRVGGRHALATGSWPLGTVRMTERFLAERRSTGKQCAALRAHVLGELARTPWLAQPGGAVVGIGGTVRNLAAAAAHAAGRAAFGVQGYRLERDALSELTQQLAKRPASERSELPGIKPERAAIILAGAVVIGAVMDATGARVLQVTEAGLREGVFFSSYLAGATPPLLADVRKATVRNLATQYQSDLGHAEHVARLADELWRALAAIDRSAGAGVDARELLWAAAMLHDIGMAIDYDDHHKHSRYLVLAAGLPGFSQREQALIAQTVRYHRKGVPELGELASLCKPGDQRLLMRLAAVLALAEHLDRSRDGTIAVAGVRERDGKLELELKVDSRGDEVLARWGAERQSDLFKRAFGRALTVA
ncbi:MAG: Ppx/GppA phosphatase family protein [Solirubrobacteraceae bacterium]|jgi:exopolyphosphatase/guanosine-5'-triphosphate,3'-diphosphate pyrophosphatase